MTAEDLEHLENVLRHINHVRDNCLLLGNRLIKNGEAEFGRKLIANGLIHDNSKLSGVEWLYLRDKGTPEFTAAAKQHIMTNPHHPEYWPGGISDMSRIYMAEMVCDWAARSQEFGNDLRDWIKGEATKKFNFSLQSRVWKDIKEFVDLLLDRAFK